VPLAICLSFLLSGVLVRLSLERSEAGASQTRLGPELKTNPPKEEP
jgi:hypothetical protein